jgi:predicted ribosome quality control (RQC) complex YloA/Tae2 family protein
VRGIRQFTNERSFALLLGDHHALVFKMHGRQGNVVLFDSDTVHSVFRNNFPADLTLTLGSLDRTIDWTLAGFKEHQHDLASFYMTFGAPVWEYLGRLGFNEKNIEEQWKLLQQVRALLENPSYFLIQARTGLRLSLLPHAKSERTFTNPIEAVNEFFFLHQSRSGLDKERAALLSSVRGRLKQSRAFLEKTRMRLAEVEGDHHYQQWADLVMANMHRITPGMESVALEDFHEPGKTVTVKLKKELTPQKNAEAFYRKAKNRAIELKTLRETLERKEKERDALLSQEQAILQATDRQALQPYAAAFSSQAKEKERKETMPYHEHTFGGFRILVGKNAASNDQLTLHHTFKEDLWLHAKDVAGSHVVIKYQSGKTFPKDVIEHAAALAAFHSKRKNESLCPVAVTPAKYVRKRKGDPPGAVVVQREDVMMVVPSRGK